MGVATKRYIRKPLYVDAVRVTTQNFDEIAAWCEGKVDTGEVPPGSGKKKKYIKVHVLQPKNVRQTMAYVGDWLLYTNGNYKIYTNKAFKMAFDLVTEEEQAGGTSADVPRDNGDNPVGAAKKKDDLPPQPRHVGGNVEIHDMRIVAEPNPEAGVHPITEVVPATPETIAQAVQENEEARVAEEYPEETTVGGTPREEINVGETPIEVEKQPSEVATEGKRVLSEHEQRVLGPDEVREMVRSGEVVLAQDLATEQA